MNPAPAKQDSLAPRTSIRLLWWFSIYFGAQLPLIPCIIAWHVQTPWQEWLEFPYGATWWLLFAVGWLISKVSSIHADDSFVSALLILPWIVYAVHLVCSLCVKKRRTFLILVWILGAIVLFNLGSCASWLLDPPTID